MLTYTTIMHGIRKDLGISIAEYCFVDTVCKLSTNPNNQERGWAYAGYEYYAEVIGLSRRATMTMATRMEKRGLIEMDRRKGGQTTLMRASETWFEKVVKLSEETSLRMVKKVHLDSEESSHNKNKYKKKKINHNLATGVAEEKQEVGEGAVVNLVMGHFEAVNPMHERLFANKSQRAALERIIKKFGADKTIGIIQSLPASNGDRWAPKITTPVELEHRLGKLVTYWKTRGQESKSKERELVGI